MSAFLTREIAMTIPRERARPSSGIFGWSDRRRMSSIIGVGARYLIAALFVLMSTRAVLAHPHVWVTMKEELIYSDDGALTGVRHIWTFDEMFSSYAVQGIPASIQGRFTRQELEELAKTNIDSLKEYRYFTSARADGKRQNAIFGDPKDYWLDYDPLKTELTLHFTLPVKRPARFGRLTLEIYDPEFFVDFGLADTSSVKLIGAPVGCSVTAEKPSDVSFPPARQTDNTSEINAGMGANFANRIVVQCP